VVLLRRRLPHGCRELKIPSLFCSGELPVPIPFFLDNPPLADASFDFIFGLKSESLLHMEKQLLRKIHLFPRFVPAHSLWSICPPAFTFTRVLFFEDDCSPLASIADPSRTGPSNLAVRTTSFSSLPLVFLFSSLGPQGVRVLADDSHFGFNSFFSPPGIPLVSN